MKTGIGKLGAVWGFLKGHIGKIGIGVSIIGAAYFGSANHHLFDRVENLIFHWHNPYETYSHSGSLKVVDDENDHGKLEKKLENSENGNHLYTIAPDTLPSKNQFIYERMFERADYADKEQLEEMYNNTRQLLDIIRENKYDEAVIDPRSVNPNRVDVVERTNNLGEVAVYLKSGTRETPLTTEKLKYFFGTEEKTVKEYSPRVSKDTSYKQASLGNPENPNENPENNPEKEEGSGLFWYLAGAGTLVGVGIRGYKKYIV